MSLPWSSQKHCLHCWSLAFLVFINTHITTLCDSRGAWWMGGASAQGQRVLPRQPGLLTPADRRLAAVPKWVFPPLLPKVGACSCRKVCEGGRDKLVRRFRKWAVGSSADPRPFVSEALWMPPSRHEPYGQQYPGQGPPSGQPPYGGHQPGLYPQQPVSGKWAGPLRSA